MVTILTLCLACQPPALPQTLNYIRGTGRRWWATEYRCDDRRNWCDRGLEGVGRNGK